MKIFRNFSIFAIFLALLGLVGCSRDAQIASHNLSEAADNFQIHRRIVFYNGITDKYMLEIEGKCAIKVDSEKNKLDVTCKTGDGIYKKHFLGISDNVTYFVEQLESAGVDTYQYKVVFKPEVIIPDIRLKVSQ